MIKDRFNCLTAIHLACIGPLIYSFLLKWQRLSLPQAPIILVLLIFCCICMVLLALFWSTTAYIFNEERSVILMLLMFGLALVNTTSSVLFMPYMSIFHPSYLTAYFIGMSFSALLPSIVSIIQGAGDECIYMNGSAIRERITPLFGVEEYNLIMLAWLLIATVSFILLNWTRLGAESSAASNNTSTETNLPVDESVLLPHQGLNIGVFKKTMVSKRLRYIILLLMMAFINAQMNGIIPSIQSFATLPYSQATYRFGLTLANIAASLACFLPLFLSTKSLGVISLLNVIASIFTAVIVVLAAMSPTPILKYSIWGQVLSVGVAVGSSLFLSYLRTLITTLVRDGGKDEKSRLFWCGVAIQIGSFIGSCIMFPLVNLLNLFESAPLCAN
ncbi:unnamed protein product [Dracunculus medinensis]|uniref:Riboflavin transporter n=1 Tax=Dracunculus medinensis TaxID=318479 RepID=A0A0N4U0U0_DRAME|nr:unnamed protein product [Dracunculus medinensis]